MKKLTALYEQDSLEFELAARLDANAIAQAIRDTLQLLARSRFSPTAVGGNYKGRFEPVALASRIVRDLDTPKGVQVGVGATLVGGDDLEYYFHAGQREISLNGTFLMARLHSGDRAANFVELVESLSARLAPLFASAHSAIELQLIKPPGVQREYRFAPAQIDDVFWLNVWGPEIVSSTGRDRVLSTPAFRVTELAYGGVLAVMRPTPVDYTSDETMDVRARALAHLRPDLDEAAIRTKLAEHARKLAPVERSFDPDVAELLDLLVAAQMRSERPSETARLNAFHPPPVSEVRDVPLPAQGKVETKIEHYGDLAEQLVALLRKDIPEIDDAEPAVLAHVDHHLWHFKFAETFKRADIDEDLVPAVGAFLGQMLVEHLGGTWVPRSKLDESQVVVAGKAFLPFLRARHALASRAAQLEYSLTQFYRVAARSR